jgi:signal transduction histidine kinase/tetratricopeptide (TPR) repeat protein
MIFLPRVFTGIFLITFISLNVWAQEEDEISPVQWYDTFFKQKNSKPVEKELKELEDQRLGAIEIEDRAAEAKALLALGLVHLTRTTDYENAINFFLEALAIHDSIEMNEYRVLNYLAIARLFENVGDYNKSIQFLSETLTMSGKLANPDIHVLVLNEFGRVNVLAGKFEDALENYNEVLTYKSKVSSRKVEADAQKNLAHLFRVQNQYSKSLEHYKRALSIQRSMRDRLSEAATLNHIGEVYHLMKNDERAMANFLVALEIYEGMKNKAGIIHSYNYIGELYYLQKKYEESISNLETGLKAGLEAKPQPQEHLRKCYELLSFSFKEIGDYKRALEYNEELVLISEFMLNDRGERQLLEKQNRYVLDKKETKIDELENVRKQREAEIAEQKKVRNFLFVILALGFIVAGLILYLYLLKRKSNKALQAAHAKVEQQNLELQNLNATKDKFFSILGHDLKGPLNSLTSFSQLLINYFDSLSKEEIQTLAKDLDKSLKNLFALLDNLLEWARSQTGNINFTPEAIDINEVLQQNKELLATQASNKEITILQENQEALIIRAHRHSITTVVRNLIANAIKFTPKGGLIKLSATLNSKEVVVSIADTGVGMSEAVMAKLFRIDSKHSTLGTDQEKGTGLGLILCKDFVEKNGGKLWVESEEGKGSVFFFTVPV